MTHRSNPLALDAAKPGQVNAVASVANGTRRKISTTTEGIFTALI